MSETHFAIRTVKHGRVRIHGKVFVPDTHHLAYDGRLDGKQFAFARYWEEKGGIYQVGIYQPVISLWGTAEEYDRGELSGCGPQVVDGTLPWLWWREMP